ncbi:hypothetical protein TCSYLVIO_002447 [Trypanosoma cruzi]|nr:hypothetical protein TCSYLVIO_002447 [Trypanosoma cruzi]
MTSGVVSSTSIGDPYKEEIAQLRALLAEGGLDKDVLEGRYLNQLRRARQLGVQLEAEKTHTRRLTAQLAALQAKVQGLGDGKGSEPSKGRVRQSEGVGGAGGQSEDQQSSVAALKERLERVYVQLSDGKVQLEEYKRESQRMRKILQQEIGGTAEELEALLKNTTESRGGWRGRAQQIVLLKGKVKELERSLTAAAAAVNASAKLDGEDSSVGAVPALVQGGRGKPSAPTEATTALTSRNRDLDDVARERVAEVQSRRLLQLRELQEELDKRTAELEAQKRRVEAAQARHVNLEADNHTLREYLQSVLTKTENDNALIDAYKEERDELQQALRTARIKLQEWEVWEGEGPARGRGKEELKNRKGHGGASCGPKEGALNTDTAVALAGADAAIEINRLKIENEELRHRLACHEANDSRRGAGSGSGSVRSSPNSAGRSRGENDSEALVLHWLRTVAPSSPSAEEPSETWQARVAEVLRRAHAAVFLLEKQREEDGGRLTKCYENIQRLQQEQIPRDGNPAQRRKGLRKSGSGDDDDNNDEASMLANVVLQENRALKKRLKVLQELMEKERVAYESLRIASSGLFPGDVALTVGHTTAVAVVGNDGEEKGGGGVGGGAKVTAAAYQQLKAQYEELRCMFNTLQKERLRHGDA